MTRRIALLAAMAGATLLGLLLVRQSEPASDTSNLRQRSIPCLDVQQQERMDCLADISLDIYREAGPAVLFAAFEALGDDTSAVGGELRGYCHDILHTVGKEAARRSGEGAVIGGASLCEGGYYHGVYMASHDVVDGGFPSDLCTSLQGEDYRNCWHGYGHSEYDDASGELFDLPDCGGTGEQQGICRDGYYMEFAIRNEVGVDELATCRDLPEGFSESCTRQLVTLAAHEHEDEVTTWCQRLQDESAAEPLRIACWHGLGAAAAWTRGEEQHTVATWEDALPEPCSAQPLCLAQSLRVYGDRHGRSEFLAEADRVLAG